MKCKKILGLLMVAVLVSSLFAALGSNPASAGQFVDEIRIEVRMDMGVGTGDTAQGVLDAFIASVEGPIYAAISPEWRAQLFTLESYGGYQEMTLNPAQTDGYAEVDTDRSGTVDFFNIWAIREVRYALNFLIDRQYICEDIYDGYAVPMYSAVGLGNPFWDEKFQPLVDDRGITYSGDYDLGYDMIQDALTDAMEHDDLLGEIRTPGDSPTRYWQYRAPGGDWDDISTVGLIRIEDRRHEIGLYVRDLLEDNYIKVIEDVQEGATAIGTFLYSEAGTMDWGYYTGGWGASAAVAYQHSVGIQMYTGLMVFMPGDFYQMFDDPNAIYAYTRDDPSGQDMYDLGEPLAAGLIPDEESYWDMFTELIDRGIHESVRVFLNTNLDFYPINRNRVTEIAPDVTTGWSQFFSPRTVKTTDGKFTAAQYSAAGSLYMSQWNAIGGFDCVYSVIQARMMRDFPTLMSPSQGIPIPMRADFVDVQMDFEYDAEGDATGFIDVPADAINYDVFAEEWYEVGEGETAATSVVYEWTFGKWHSGHDFTMQDLAAWYAFNKQLCWDTDAGPHYFVGGLVPSQIFFNNIIGIIFDEANDRVTYYGDYTFFSEAQVGGYYATMPEVPWQLYEAATQLRGETDLAPGDTFLDQGYGWSPVTGTNQVHWLSDGQGADYTRVLQNMVDEDFVPPYLRADRNSPFPLDLDQYADDVAAMRGFFAEYDHFWITHGPFRLVNHDRANMVMEMVRFTEDEGYPWAPDYWRNRLAIARMRLGTLTAPRRVEQGDVISISSRANVAEEYPARVTRDLRPADRYEAWAELVLDGVVLSTEEVTMSASRFSATFDTEGMAPGVYEARIVSELEDQLAPAIASAGVEILPTDEVQPPEPVPVPEGVTNIDLSVSPTSGEVPLTVTVTVSADNEGEEEADLDIYLDGSVWQTLSIPAEDSATGTYEREFEVSGQYLFQVGEEFVRVTVEPEAVEPPEDDDDDTPGFAFVLLAIGLSFAVLVYHTKKR